MGVGSDDLGGQSDFKGVFLAALAELLLRGGELSIARSASIEFSSFSSAFFATIGAELAWEEVIVGVYFGGVVVFSNVKRRSAVVSIGDVVVGTTATLVAAAEAPGDSVRPSAALILSGP